MGVFLTDLNSIIDTIEIVKQLESSNTADELFETFTAHAEKLGFKHVALGVISNPSTLNSTLRNFGLSSFPNEFSIYWNEKNYIVHDPVIRYANLSSSTFLWETAKAHATIFGKKVYTELKNFDISNGICIPIKVGIFPKGMISLSHDDPDFKNDEITKLQLVCIHTFTHYLKLIDAQTETQSHPLTKREIEVLHYVAGGKSNWEVSRILSISEDGVKKHMQNVLRKLDADNRTHAVTIGMKTGQILP